MQLTDGRTVPMPPLGWGDDRWPYVDASREALAALAANRQVELGLGASRLDRHGHLLAQVFVASGDSRLWLQEALIAKGLARVYSLSRQPRLHP